MRIKPSLTIRATVEAPICWKKESSFSRPYSDFAFVLVRKGLGKYVDSNEYDGLESPSISPSRMVMGEVDRAFEANEVLSKEEYNAIKSTDIRLTYIKLQHP